MTGLTTICVSDPLKLLIQYQGYSGFEIQTWFEQMGIYVELADDKQVLFVLPLWHEDDKYPFETLLNKITKSTYHVHCQLNNQHQYIYR